MFTMCEVLLMLRMQAVQLQLVQPLGPYKVSHGMSFIAQSQAKKGTRVQSFYTMPEYEAWREGMSDGAAAGWDIKYYKGLGTSTNKEAKEYFAAMEAHR